jgi:hypothetical protein
VDDVHSGDAGVGSREGDDAGQFVTVEYAMAWVAVDVEDFEAFGGCGLRRKSAQEAGCAATSPCTFGNGMRMSMQASALLPTKACACAWSACTG